MLIIFPTVSKVWRVLQRRLQQFPPAWQLQPVPSVHVPLETFPVSTGLQQQSRRDLFLPVSCSHWILELLTSRYTGGPSSQHIKHKRPQPMKEHKSKRCCQILLGSSHACNVSPFSLVHCILRCYPELGVQCMYLLVSSYCSDDDSLIYVKRYVLSLKLLSFCILKARTNQKWWGNITNYLLLSINIYMLLLSWVKKITRPSSKLFDCLNSRL